MQAIGLLSVVIWLPIVGGMVTLALRRCARARGALDRAARPRCATLAACVPLYARLHQRHREIQFVERAPGSRRCTRSTTSGSTASRCR